MLPREGMRTLALLFALVMGCGSARVDEPEPPIVDPVSAGPTALGHLDVPAMAHGARHAARLFYSYRPSDDDDGRKPLFVFMNGGPGFATSMGLLSWGIGPKTLSTDADGVSDNPARWTRFGNLLFLDERHAGFSYGRRPALEDGSCDPLDDAADHLFAVLTFLKTRPSFSRVVLVGESYGGMRVVSMLKLLRDPTLAPTEELRQAIAEAGDLAKRFTDAVLIQPLVLGDAQYKAQKELLERDPLLAKVEKGHDGHDVRRTMDEMSALDERALRAFADPAMRASLLGGAIESVGTMLPSARTDAFRDVQSWGLEAEKLPDRELSTRLGPLADGDRYYAPMARSCVSFFGPEWVRPWFVELLADTRFFITNARYDAAIHTPAIPAALRSLGLPVDEDERAFTVHTKSFDATVRWQRYESGHAVAQSTPRALADDVQAWLARP